jgi:hypothetical protein
MDEVGIGLFGEERRRTKAIPHAFGERAVLKLMYAAVLHASQTDLAANRDQRIRIEADRRIAKRTRPRV